MTTHDFDGHVAVITGGSGDIGLAVANEVAARGAAVVLCDVARNVAYVASALSRQHDVPTLGLSFDVTHDADIGAALSVVHDRFGRIDHLFNNAGTQGEFAPIDRYPIDDFRRVLEVNVVGAFQMLRAAVPFLRRTSGSVVNTASHAGVAGPPNMAAYAASKFAVVGLTETAAKDLARDGIRVNAVSPALIGPGTMWTRQVELQAAAGSPYFDSDPSAVAAQMVASVPMRRLGALEEVARAVAFLLSDQASYITGTNLLVTGGL
jgi:NAD(P)-dependent dehydrogenase (short-subunit alcohol dehydrogenase family)